jgi:phosphoribulokinase
MINILRLVKTSSFFTHYHPNANECVVLHNKMWCYGSKGKGKTIQLQAWTDPEGSRRLRVSDFKTFGT